MRDSSLWLSAVYGLRLSDLNKETALLFYVTVSGFCFGEFGLKPKWTQRCRHVVVGLLRIRRMLDTNGDHVLRQRPGNLRRLCWLVLPLFQVASLQGRWSAKHTFTLNSI